jgi:flagellar motor switch protein FliM
MTVASANLSNAKVRRLLAAVGSARVVEDAATQVAMHDWRHPHYFTGDQLNRLSAVADQVAATIAGQFEHFFHCELTVAAAPITQQFAGTLREITASEERYYLAFGPAKDNPCGFFSITARTALRWVTRLLGDAEMKDDANRPLASLEESLLGDLTGAVAETFLASLRPHQDLRPGERITREAPMLRSEPTQEICTVVFAVTKKDSDEKDDMLFLLPCSTLDPLAGKSRQAVRAIPAEELSRILMDHVALMPVTVTARLARIMVRSEEFLDLEGGDILLLDKPVAEPVELLVDGRVAFRGRPASVAGCRAVLILESAVHPAAQKPKSAAVN